MANRDHKHVHIQRGDTIILSSTPVPGNESLVNRTVDSLFKQGAHVIYSKLGQVHVHGHGSQEELKLVLSLVKPRFFVPIHGEYRHLTLHAQLAESIGMPSDRIFIMEDGDVLELNSNYAKINGKVNSGHVYVDGLSVGDIGGVVLRTRRMLSRDGIVIVIIAVNRQTGKLVGRPDILSRGFMDDKDFGVMIEESRQVLIKALDHSGGRITEMSFINSKVRDTLDKFYYDRTKRRPMILPFMVKV
jgi:ribonuclease J